MYGWVATTKFTTKKNVDSVRLTFNNHVLECSTTQLILTVILATPTWIEARFLETTMPIVTFTKHQLLSNASEYDTIFDILSRTPTYDLEQLHLTTDLGKHQVYSVGVPDHYVVNGIVVK
jgi:hypothetical protein